VAVRSVPASLHNRVLRRATKRVDRLESRLADVLAPILDQAGDRAARAFQAMATDHLAASGLGIVAAGGLRGVSGTSTMVCVKPRPDEAEAIVDPGGSPPDTLHVTLAVLRGYAGDVAGLAAALAPVAADHGPLEGRVGGYGVFDPPGCGILLPDVPGLVELRVAVTEALQGADVGYARDHGFQPHLTVDGDPEPDEADQMLERAAGAPLHFDAILVVRGDAVVAELPLVGVRPITAAADPPPWTSPAPDEILDVEALVALIKERTHPVREAMVKTTMSAALAQAGLSWDVTNPFTAKVLAQSGSKIADIATTTQLNVMRTIRVSYQNGLSIPHTAEAIRAGMRAATPARATMIARTELAGAVNGGSLAATQIVSSATGDGYFKEWMTAAGAKYPRHEDYDGLDGQEQPLDGYFDVGDNQLQHPGDPDGDPGETINCRCSMSYSDAQGDDLGEDDSGAEDG
jgi:2'-5' RNA ligase